MKNPYPSILLPSGVRVYGRFPPAKHRTLFEHALSDDLAHDLQALIEVRLPFGRADIATESLVFETEALATWRHGVRQVLAYHAQTGLAPCLALFGEAHRVEVLKMFLRLQSATPSIQLWWRSRHVWCHLQTKRDCRKMYAPEIYEHVPSEPVVYELRDALTQAALDSHRLLSPMENLPSKKR